MITNKTFKTFIISFKYLLNASCQFGNPLKTFSTSLSFDIYEFNGLYACFTIDLYFFVVIGFIITFVIPATSKIYLVNSFHEQITSLIA